MSPRAGRLWHLTCIEKSGDTSSSAILLNPTPRQKLNSIAPPPLMKKTLLPFCLAACFALGSATVLAQKADPKPVSTPLPGYPEALTDTGLNGLAEVDLTVKADGSIADVQLGMATHRAFGKAAMAVVANWKFQPGTQDGAPVDRRMSVPFRFTAPFDQTINAIAKRKVFLASLPETPVSEKDFPAKKLKAKRPARAMIPPSLARADIDEKVQVKFVVSPEGLPLNPSIGAEAKHKELEPAAIQAVALMSFEPPKKDGKPVYVETTYAVEFTTARRGGGGGGDFGGGGFGGGGGRGGRGGGGGGGEDGGGD
jgi:TonB family protein